MEVFPPNLDPNVSTSLEGQLDKAKLGSKSVTVFTSNLPSGSYQANKVPICVKKFNPDEKLAKPRVTGLENSDLLKKLSSNPPIQLHYRYALPPSSLFFIRSKPLLLFSFSCFLQI